MNYEHGVLLYLLKGSWVGHGIFVKSDTTSKDTRISYSSTVCEVIYLQNQFIHKKIIACAVEQKTQRNYEPGVLFHLQDVN